jgi:hypothetical protein
MYMGNYLKLANINIQAENAGSATEYYYQVLGELLDTLVFSFKERKNSSSKRSIHISRWKGKEIPGIHTFSNIC